MDTPLVSIIMPSYNSADFIAETLQSVLAQTYDNWELLIADDKSTDDTQDIVKKFQDQDSRIHFFPSKRNFGPAVTRNRAIDRAQGRFIAFLDSDDLWTPDKLEKQIAFMMNNNIALSYGWYDVIDEQGNKIREKKTPKKTVTYNELLKNQIIGCLTAIYDTQLCQKQKLPVIRKRQDFALWLRILKQGHIAHCVEDVIGSYRIRSNSVSRNKWVAVMFTWKLYREVERLPLITSCYIFSCYIVNKLLGR